MSDGPPFDMARNIWSAPWTAVLFRSRVFAVTGLLEETFESYLEDAEFGLRCAALGIAGRYVPEARAIHAGSASLGRWHPEMVRLIARNQLWIAARHPAAGHFWPALVAQFLWGGIALRHGAGLAWLRGKWEGLRRFSALRRQRPDVASALLEPILRSNEQFLRRYCDETYWRLYLMLTREAK
jgi:GT2 family glycosyltransferase